MAVWQSGHGELLRLLEGHSRRVAVWQSEHEELLTLLEDEWPCGSQDMENY